MAKGQAVFQALLTIRTVLSCRLECVLGCHGVWQSWGGHCYHWHRGIL